MTNDTRGNKSQGSRALDSTAQAGRPPARSIPAAFAQVVKSVPLDHLAYVGADGSFTYTEIDRASNQLAHAILDLIGNAEEETQKVVALLLPHTVDSIVGVLGVLKTGHLCVPLAPEHGTPHHRLVAEDCQRAAVVTIRSLLTQADAISAMGVPILTLDTLPALTSAAPPSIEISPQTYALLFYTSGTTGRPRGVIRAHAQTTAYAAYQADDLNLTSTSRVAHLNSYAMAGSAMMLYGALLNGATLYAYSLQGAALSALYEFLLAHQITTMSSLVSTLRHLAELSDRYPPLASMRAVVTGGESIHAQDVTSILRILPTGCQLICSLSSTEISTFARLFVEAGSPWEGDRVPAGYPPPYIELMIVDDEKRPLRPGTEGEIAVRSRYLTPGYWNQPALNAARFLPDPEGGDCRILLTGDRGFINGEGMLEHRGRIDFMVKVRGYRVEPETIERVLLQHPNVFECVVVARRSRSDDSQLVAYLVAHQHPIPTLTALRDLLAQTLPSYMIPSRFVFLDSLPRNPNHKVNRSALPAPGHSRPEIAANFVAPRTEAESAIAAIWMELLDLDEVGVEDDFFELGGDSLVAMRMLRRVEEAFVHLNTTQFFRKPDIAHLLCTGDDKEYTRTTSPVPMRHTVNQPQRQIHITQRLRSKITTGPVWRGHALPYSLGVNLQRLVFAVPAVQKAYADQLTVVTQWYQEMGLTSPYHEIMTINLLANTWMGWRQQALSRCLDLHRWYKVQDLSHTLGRIPSPSSGIVLATCHVGRVGSLLLKVCQKRGYETGIVAGGEDVGPQARAEMLWNARQVLHRGGLVMVAADGLQGNQAIEVPFWGRRRPFQIGAAELAVSTGAAFVPVYTCFDTKGRINVEITAPLIASAASSVDQIRELTMRYAADYVARWPYFFASMRWPHLAYNLNLQRCD